MGRLLMVVAAVAVGIVAWKMLTPAPKPPVLDPEEWWGPAALQGEMDTSIRPFEIKFNQTVSGLFYLRRRS